MQQTKLIVCLGNPGKQYEFNRHNIGFLFADFLEQKLSNKKPKNFIQKIFQKNFKYERKYLGFTATKTLDDKKIIILKPDTFMNKSGESVQKIKNFFKIKEENIIIIYDDIDIKFEKIKFKKTGNSGGHNGLKSIFEKTGTKNIARIKIGIYSELKEKIGTSNFVLSNFTKQEIEKLNTIFETVFDKLEENFIFVSKVHEI